MGELIKYIADETDGKAFGSFKYGYDNDPQMRIPYEEQDLPITPKQYAESVKIPQARDMTAMSQQLSKYPPLFHYFLDGSRMVYKVDDIQYDKKVYPLVAGQISVACCERIMQADGISFGSFQHVEEETYSVLALPTAANSRGIDSGVFFRNLCNKINESQPAKRKGIRIQKVLVYTSSQQDGSFDKLATARIQDEMVDCEKKIVATLVAQHKLTPDNYLIKDGSLQYKTIKTGDFGEMKKIRANYQRVVGVSKMFNPNLMRNNKGQSIAAEIANLPLFHRTPAIMWEPDPAFCEANFAIWYVRVRERDKTATPYSGILKIEKMLMTGEEAEHGLQTDEVDMITANIINERNPVCYGKDARWANHLYPIYMTESYCKSKFKSEYYFLNIF